MAILSLHGTPTIEEIQAARRLQLKVWHPDRFLDDPVVRAEAERRTKLINEAWRTLESVYELRGPGSDGGDTVDKNAEPARRVGGWTSGAEPAAEQGRPKRWPEGVVTAVLCAGWLIPIVAGALGLIGETAAIGAFIVFVLVAYAYLVLTRFV